MAKYKYLAIIPARGGSKGIPKKNIIDFCGKPLIAWTIEAAKNAKQISKIIVSSDSDEIGAVAMAYGSEFGQRPYILSSDSAVPKDAVLFHINELEKTGEFYDFIVLLQPTSPLRTTQDIIDAIEMVENESLDSCASFTKAATHPVRAWKNIEGKPQPFLDNIDPWQMRQALEPAYELNGAVYIVNVAQFRNDKTNSFLIGKSGMTIMPEDRSIDIDTILDLQIASLFFNNNLK
jgi:CMP-N,N'-diacetyllegionaminic acid synthase